MIELVLPLNVEMEQYCSNNVCRNQFSKQRLCSVKTLDYRRQLHEHMDRRLNNC